MDKPDVNLSPGLFAGFLWMDEKRSLLFGQRIVKTAVGKELFGRGDSHQLVDIPFAGALDTTHHEPAADPAATILRVDGETLNLSKLS